LGHIFIIKKGYYFEFLCRAPAYFRYRQTLFAYELLFHGSLENIFPKNVNDNEATAKIIEGLEFNLGLESFIQDSLALST
jgi:EAL and modified HD-GYP domain-containing signal transduction protein